MLERGARLVDAGESRLARAHREVRVLHVGEVAFVEESDLLEDFTLHEQTTPRQRVDDLALLVAPGVDAVEASQRSEVGTPAEAHAAAPEHVAGAIAVDLAAKQ